MLFMLQNHQEFPQHSSVSAMKTIREVTGWGLKEAKDAIDAMRQGAHVDFYNVYADDFGKRSELRSYGIIPVPPKEPVAEPKKTPDALTTSLRHSLDLALDKGQYEAAKQIVEILEDMTKFS